MLGSASDNLNGTAYAISKCRSVLDNARWTLLALTRHAHSQQVEIEIDAGIGVPHYDCGMVDTEKQLIRWTVPLLQALVGWKLQHLNRVRIWILKVEGRDARRVPVPVWKPLWS